jgi:hypothetical protein
MSPGRSAPVLALSLWYEGAQLCSVKFVKPSDLAYGDNVKKGLVKAF